MEKTLKKTAKEIMSKKVISVREDENIKELFKILDQNGILGVPVVNDKRHVVGIITETDLIRHFTTLETPRSVNLLGAIIYLDNIADFNASLKDHAAELVKNLMTGEEVITVKESTPLLTIINTMSENHITRVPVVNGKKELVGIITRTDIVHQLAKIEQV